MIKKIITTSILLVTFCAITFAQKNSAAKVEKAAEQLRKAMVDGDSATLANLVSANLSYGHSGGHIDDKTEFVQKLVSGGSDFVTIEIKAQSINVTKKTAVLRHILNAKTNDKGKPAEVHLRVLQIWQKQHGKWKLLARQAVKIEVK